MRRIVVQTEGNFEMELQRHNILHLPPNTQGEKSKKGNQRSLTHQVPIPEEISKTSGMDLTYCYWHPIQKRAI